MDLDSSYIIDISLNILRDKDITILIKNKYKTYKITVYIMVDENSCKVVLIGDSGVGKSSLMFWYMNGRPMTDAHPTVGAAFCAKRVNHNSRIINLNIWDTAGQERYKSLVKMYYKDTIGCICVFDLTDRKTFENMDYWIENYRRNNNNDFFNMIIVANKCDLSENKWTVTEQEVRDFANIYGCDYVYASSLNGKNVVSIFYLLIDKILGAGSISNEKSSDKTSLIDLYSPFNMLEKINVRRCF